MDKLKGYIWKVFVCAGVTFSTLVCVNTVDFVKYNLNL
jgi:hypothetical protein